MTPPSSVILGRRGEDPAAAAVFAKKTVECLRDNGRRGAFAVKGVDFQWSTVVSTMDS